jgi:cell division protein FtsI (penicillin-binding protein 3)
MRFDKIITGALRVAVLTAGCAIVGAGAAGCASGAGAASGAAPEQSSGAKPAAKAGSTIDAAMQAIADEELGRAVGEWGAAAGAVVVLDPATGEVLANAGRAHGAPADVGLQSAFVTGSTLKTFTLAAALEEGVVSPGDKFDCENGKWVYQGKELHDASPNGVLSVPEMLATSTNVGFTKVYDRLGGGRLGRWLRAFHFGAAPVAGATAGQMPERIDEKSYEGAIVAIGESIKASPLQVAAAYAAVANGGAYVAPTLSRRAGPAPREQIMKPETARTLVTMLEGVVTGERGTGKLAQVPGVRVAGKTGTASWQLPDGREGIYASFVGFAPSDAPRVVVLVGLEQPREGGTGGKAAAPAFARVASRVLAAR